MTAQQRLAKAAEDGDLDALRKALADGADPNDSDCLPLRFAAVYGHSDCLTELIPLSDTDLDESGALRSAANAGNLACVELLIPVSDPKALNSEALRSSAEEGYGDCARILIPVSDVDLALKLMRSDGNTDAVALVESIIEEERLMSRFSSTGNQPRTKVL